MKEDEINEGNKFDKILKENISEMFLPLLDKRFNLGIKDAQELTPKFQTTIEREVDFLRLITDKNGNDYILHIEFQTTYDSELIFRIKEYEAMIQRRYKLPVKSYVITLDSSKRSMQNKLQEKFIFSEFNELNFSKIDSSYFLNSGIPQIIIFAILGDLSKSDISTTIKEVILQLQKQCTNKATFNKFIDQLLMLSQIRKLDTNVFQTLQFMPLNIDIRKNAAVAPLLEELEVKLKSQQFTLKSQESTLKSQESTLKSQELKLESLKNQITHSTKKLLLKNTMTVEEIAEILDVPVEFVLKTKEELDPQ